MSRSIWATALAVSAVALAVFTAALMPGVALAAGGSSAVHAQPQSHRATVLGLGSGLSTPSRAVRSLQTKLTAGGFTPGPVDGRFGPMTRTAVQRFQQADGLAVDGIVGPHTRRGLAAGGLLPGAGAMEPGGSTAVKRLQRRLERSGFSPGAADGRYGPRTAAAVKRFQQARHLAASGIASAATLRALANHTRRPALQPAPPPKRSPAPAKPKAKHNPTNTNPAPAPAQPVVHEPSSFPWTILLLLGVVAIGLLAVFAVVTRRPKRRVAEPQTVAPQADEPPVTAAQAVSRDPTSSVAQIAALQAAVAMPLAGSPTNAGNNGTVDMPAPLVVDEPESSGERVERVKALQTQLRSLGFDPGPADGRYGALTTDAVTRFQEAHDLPVDGVLGPLTALTLRLLLGRPADERVQRVKALQCHLSRLGLEPGAVDGRYGPMTTGAVRRFQEAHGLTVDGVVGPLTADALAATARELAISDRIEGVKSLQRQLTWLGFDPGLVDGRYGPQTTEAVRRFQEVRGLPVDGVADPLTLTALRAGTPDRPFSGRVQRVQELQRELIGLEFEPGPDDGRYGPRTTEAVKRFQRARHLPDDGITDQATLEALHGQKPTQQPFMRHEERVKELQHQLGALGLEPGLVDGRYGPITTDAVRRFQHAHDLPVDGVADPVTLSALKASVKGSPFIARTERVKELQRQLHRLGLEPGMVDGRYGPLTTQAVKRFQEAHNLPADGIADPDTLGRIQGQTPAAGAEHEVYR